MEAEEVGVDAEDKLSGFIFMCNKMTKPECYRYRVFALPAGRKHVVERINPGMHLFLFDTDVKLLYGTYLATSTGMLNIEPFAFQGRFPAQVSFKIYQDCWPLPENQFKHAIKENYQNHSHKFNPELNTRQVSSLLKMFRPLDVPTTVPRHPGLNEIHSASMLQLPPRNGVFHQTPLSGDSYLSKMSPTHAPKLMSYRHLNGLEEPTGWANYVAGQSVPSQASRNQILAVAYTNTPEGAYATRAVSRYTPSLPYPQYAHEDFLNVLPEFHSFLRNDSGHAQSMQNFQRAELNVLHSQPEFYSSMMTMDRSHAQYLQHSQHQHLNVADTRAQFHSSTVTVGSRNSYDQSLQYSQQAHLNHNVLLPPPDFHSSMTTDSSCTQSLQDPPRPGVDLSVVNVGSSHAQMPWDPHSTHQNIQNLQPGYYSSATNVSSSYGQSFLGTQHTYQEAQNLQPDHGSSVNMNHTNVVMQPHGSTSPYVPQHVISTTYSVQGTGPHSSGDNQWSTY
ncbi:unnamed protein product [Lathyrus sativus]|nr:unnamed protein product [Lathyrus sativus]